MINTIEIKEDSRLESLAKNRTAVWFPDGFFQASVRGFEHNRAIGPLISHISAIFAGNFADVLDASVDFDVVETYGVFLEQRIGTLMMVEKLLREVKRVIFSQSNFSIYNYTSISLTNPEFEQFR